MKFDRKYNTGTVAGTHIPMRLLKAGSDACATNTDWTPTAGDVMIKLDGGTEAEITALPTYDEGWWFFPLATGETACKTATVRIDNASIQSDGFIVETFGHVNAMYPDDASVASSSPSDIATAVGERAPHGMSYDDMIAAGGAANFDINTGTGVVTIKHEDGTVIGTRAISRAAVGALGAIIDMIP